MKRLAVLLVPVGGLHEDPAAREVIAIAIELRRFRPDLGGHGGRALNVSERDLYWEDHDWVAPAGWRDSTINPDRTGLSPTLWLGRTYPRDFVKTIEQAQGKFPDFPKTDIVDLADARPNTAQNLWTTKAFVNFLWRDEVPAYSVLWLGDPDFSQHLTDYEIKVLTRAIEKVSTHARPLRPGRIRG